MHPDEALALLRGLGASHWLVRHHELVLEAATILVERIPCDRARVLAGAALHDAGKIVHPGEQHAPGHAHELAGEQLLVAHGVPAEIARCCVTHATGDGDREDLLVALADKLWKGKRDEVLEARAVSMLADGRPAWEAFAELDAIFADIAAGGPDRLARSQV